MSAHKFRPGDDAMESCAGGLWSRVTVVSDEGRGFYTVREKTVGKRKVPEQFVHVSRLRRPPEAKA